METSEATMAGPGVQYAALPFRRNGEISILLITSRESGRWVIPKGWPIRGLKPHAAAAREAYEEAGVSGRITKKPIGFYRYDKRLPTGETRRCTVQVFPLEVERQRKRWREQGQRTLRWFSLDEAAEAVAELELHDLIHIFGLSHGQRPNSACGAALAMEFVSTEMLVHEEG